eukprot:GHVS01025069.1.p1 GENE.GHVS01025069.1~~GHVS01025069.1.p1  ORF type:complete len:194 (-),score=34.07 GHVS01025069.1:244-825(-)
MGGPGKQQYVIEDIVAYRREKRQDFYLVKWKGYKVEENSWEPRKNLLTPNDPTVAKMKHLKRTWKPNLEAVVSEGAAAEGPAPLSKRKKVAGEEGEEEAGTSEDSLGSSPSRLEEVEEADETFDDNLAVTVRTIKPFRKKLRVQAIGQGLPPAKDQHYISMTDCRNLYPQPLISFLLKNLRFVNNGNSGTSVV